MLPGNAELAEVEPGRILIRRGGRYETLTFEEQVSSDLVAEVAAEPAAEDARTPPAPEAPEPAGEQAANRPGRMSDGPSGHRSAFDDTDWHELEKERFAKALSEILYKQAHTGRYDRIVLVAPPAVLGDLRDNLHKEVQDKVIGEIPKTLTNHPIDDIEKIVAGELAEA